jgi:cytochrome c biogenesis protein ResB
MAFSAARVAIGTAATYINGTDIQPMQLWVHNDDGTSDIWLGGPDVTQNNGLLLEKLESVFLTILPGNYLYAAAGKDPHFVSYLAQRF